MTNSPLSPRLIKGGLVLIDPTDLGGAAHHHPAVQPRKSKPLALAADGGRRVGGALQGAPGGNDPGGGRGGRDRPAGTARSGRIGQPNLTVLPILSALEEILYPPSSQLVDNQRLAERGTLSIIPMQSLLVLFVWSKNRIIPVRLNSLSVVEEAFDSQLNPIRAKIHLEMRVLSVSDLGFGHKGGTLVHGLPAKEGRTGPPVGKRQF